MRKLTNVYSNSAMNTIQHVAIAKNRNAIVWVMIPFLRTALTAYSLLPRTARRLPNPVHYCHQTPTHLTARALIISTNLLMLLFLRMAKFRFKARSILC